jgi:hypothetical protein
MTEETRSKSRPPLAKQAALASVLAPGIAVLVNVMTISSQIALEQPPDNR